MLTRDPNKITIGEIVCVLEGGIDLSECIENPDVCSKSKDCLARGIWQEATKAMHNKLNSVTLSDMIQSDQGRVRGNRQL